MGYLRNVKETDFFNELTSELQKKYFSITRDKYLPTIDNIYYSVFLKNDSNENVKMKRLLEELEELKIIVLVEHEPQEFKLGLLLDNKSYKLYKYCLSNPDLYDIFILSYLPNNNTPRILIQIRSFGLWVYSADKMLMGSCNHVIDIFKPLGCEIESCRENRIDYCYHTNIMVNPEKVLSDRNIKKHMKTTMKVWKQVGRINIEDDGTVLKKDYFALGERSSNNVFIRLYNKGLEVIEQGYKSFFFDIWYKNGLINFYDKYCLEYAYTQTQKDYDYIHKGKLYFYLEYGTDSMVKKEMEIVLKDSKSTMQDFKDLSSQYMPEVTTIMNIEFETKRKFYYYSDDFIDTMLKYKPREGTPDVLNRLFRIIDNRAVFLDYLTSKTLCFGKKLVVEDEKTKFEYASWWERLRNTKLEGITIDEKLLRVYSNRLDEKLAQKRFINTVATNAVYNDNVDTDFISDISDLLSNINDNDINKFMFVSAGSGELIDSISGDLLESYDTIKIKKEKLLKNRKKTNLL